MNQMYQTCILHRNDRLGGETLQQHDLLVSERTDLLAVDGEGTENRIVLTQWHSEQGSTTAQFSESAADRITGPIGVVRPDIRNLHYRPTFPRFPGLRGQDRSIRRLGQRQTRAVRAAGGGKWPVERAEARYPGNVAFVETHFCRRLCRII